MVIPLAFSEVCKRFGPQQALRGLSFEVPPGTIFGLIGPNGAGKTTAFSVACGFLQPDSGNVTVLGESRLDPDRLNGRLAAVLQDAAFSRHSRCFEQMVFLGRLQGLPATRARHEADRLLDEVGLTDRRQARIRTLSHGMLRRLAVAQALLGSPELILLDEPTSGLDPRQAQAMVALLRRIRSPDCTLVISSHNMPEMETLCDHVAVINRGQRISSGLTAAMRGQEQDIEVTLGAGPMPLEALRTALANDGIVWDDHRRVLRVTLQQKPQRDVEDVVRLILRVLIEEGASITGVRRGGSLEDKFLDLTRPSESLSG